MKKCVIIGGGPAGLTAGYELLKNSKDYEVVILEQSDTLGGISRTVKYNGNRMDIGGHRFFSKDKQVTDFWSELMPTQGAPSIDDKILGREKALVPGGPDPEKEDRVMLIRRRISRIYYLHKFFDYPITMKPQTFMNNSGEAVRQAASFYKIPPERILVVFDDISLPCGRLRIRRKGSDGGHNGIKSIIYHLNSDAFPRVKLGVGEKPHPDYDLADWVLSQFKKDELALLREAAEKACSAAELIVAGDIDKAMSNFNG